MLLNKNFSLLGTGLVRDMIRYEDHWVCAISIIHQLDARKKHSDEIMLRCRIEDQALLQLFVLLEGDFFLGRTIALRFEAKYLNFDDAYIDQDKDYQNHLLHFNAKLLSVEACLINGERFDFGEMRVAKKVA